MEGLQETLNSITGLDAALYGSAPVLALLLRFGRAYWRWFDDPHTLAGGLLLGVVGAVLVLTMEPRAWQFITMQSLSLSVAVLAVERVLRSAASKVAWLPRDNEWAPTPEFKP